MYKYGVMNTLKIWIIIATYYTGAPKLIVSTAGPKLEVGLQRFRESESPGVDSFGLLAGITPE